MGVLQKISFDTISNRISFLFKNAKSVVVDSTSFVVTGTVIIHAGTTVPSGFLLCDGRPVARSAYPNLFKRIATIHGDGTKNADGTNSIYGPNEAFNLPDFRGRFLRGVDGTAGRDFDSSVRLAANVGGNSGNSIGSIQASATKTDTITVSNNAVTSQGMSANSSHTHGLVSGYNFITYGFGASPPRDGWAVNGSNPYRNHATNHLDDLTNTSVPHKHPATAASSLAAGDAETRPLNLYLNYIIKT